MKKVLALFLALLMAAGLTASLAVTSSADEEKMEYVEPYYEFNPIATQEWGSGQNPVQGGLWRFDYYDRTAGNEGFYPMAGWEGSDGGSGTESNYFEPMPNLRDTITSENPYWYCRVRTNGAGMHPGKQADSVRTFIVPASAIISYEASLYQSSGTSIRGKEDAGDDISVWLNDEKCLWPAADFVNGETVTADDVAKQSVTIYANEDATVIELNNIRVEAGDEIHLRVGAVNNNSAEKAVTVNYTKVYYIEADDYPVGNPNGTPPSKISYRDLVSDSVTLAWDEAIGAVGYNVYMNGEKITSEPITTQTYEVTGLEAGSIYKFTVTTITSTGSESEPSPQVSIRTPNDATIYNPTATTEDPNSTNATDPSEPGSGSSTHSAQQNSVTGVIIGIVVAAVAVILVIVVVVVLVSKKKKTGDSDK